jgi:hypothetical protein
MWDLSCRSSEIKTTKEILLKPYTLTKANLISNGEKELTNMLAQKRCDYTKLTKVVSTQGA